MYRMLGLMSGTSLDGLDLCRCDLTVDGERPTWRYRILRAATVPYPPEWRERLDGAIASPPEALGPLDRDYGAYLAGVANDFLADDEADVVVASHGHTVHHEPARGYTRQIGDPATLARGTGRRVVADFRRLDVRLGGEGAPLVPLADRLLFGAAAACVNLGGFANLSYESVGRRLAADVTVCNLLLDRLAARRGLRYDPGGRLASGGQADAPLARELAADPFFARAPPKSLGREWFEAAVWPRFSRKLDDGTLSVEDALATAVAHVSTQLAASLRAAPPGEVLVTGGGAHNVYLLEGLRQNLPAGMTLAPVSDLLVDYKEALAFALLGALRLRGETNVLSSVTGARRDSSSGTVVEPALG